MKSKQLTNNKSYKNLINSPTSGHSVAIEWDTGIKALPEKSPEVPKEPIPRTYIPIYIYIWRKEILLSMCTINYLHTVHTTRINSMLIYAIFYWYFCKTTLTTNHNMGGASKIYDIYVGNANYLSTHAYCVLDVSARNAV